MFAWCLGCPWRQTSGGPPVAPPSSPVGPPSPAQVSSSPSFGVQALDFRSLRLSWFLHHKAFLGCWLWSYNINLLLVPDTQAQCTHQFLTRMISMFLRPFSNLEFLRVRNWCVCSVSSWRVCSANASVPDPYAQGTQVSEGTALLKIRLSICVRNFAAHMNP